MIIKDSIYMEPFGCQRRLHIYLPDDIQAGERFPVLYMFDGHNLFLDSDAAYGKSWGMKDYMDRHNVRMIVVGLECNHEGWARLDEFSPYSYYDPCDYQVNQKGQITAQWMKTVLKDYIDHTYPTLAGRGQTFVGGSSMGGLMALYMTLMHSDCYGKGIAVSPFLYPLFDSLKADLGHPVHPDTTLYISWGGREENSQELASLVTDQNLQVVRAFLEKPGVTVYPYCFHDHGHYEADWEKEMPVWMGLLKGC